MSGDVNARNIIHSFIELRWRLTLNHCGFILMHFSASAKALSNFSKLINAKHRLLRRAFIISVFDFGVNSMAKV